MDTSFVQQNEPNGHGMDSPIEPGSKSSTNRSMLSPFSGQLLQKCVPPRALRKLFLSSFWPEQ